MWIRTQTINLQILFYKFLCNSLIIFKNNLELDNAFEIIYLEFCSMSAWV